MAIHPDYTPDSADFYAGWEESLDSFAPDWRTMTDETLALASDEADAERDEYVDTDLHYRDDKGL
jgi:hypothetical protein